MAAIRLNKDMREKIVKKIIGTTNDDGISAINLEFEEIKTELGLKVIDILYPENLRKKLDEFPKGFVEYFDYIDIYFQGFFRGHIRINYENEIPIPYFARRSIDLRKTAKIPTHYNGERDVFSLYEAGYLHTSLLKIVKEYQDEEVKNDKQQEEFNKDYRKVTSTVESFSTAEALKKGWPEIANIVDFVVYGYNKTQVPALPLDDLNKKYKLPKDFKHAG